MIVEVSVIEPERNKNVNDDITFRELKTGNAYRTRQRNMKVDEIPGVNGKNFTSGTVQ